MASGKKILLWGCLGCGGFIGLIILLVIGSGAFFAYKAVEVGKEIGREYTELSTNYQALDQDFPFTPPADQMLTEDRLQEFLQIRTSALEFAKQYDKEFSKLGDDIGATFEQGGILSIFTGAGKIGEIIKTAVKLPSTIGNEHIRLLQEARMSPDEYHWYTKEILGTLQKATEQQSEMAQDLWSVYTTAFEEGRRQFQGTNVNTGQVQFSGSDIQMDALIKKLNDVEFIEKNAELIAQNAEQFKIDGKAAMLDYMALHLDELLGEFTKKSQ